MVAGVVVSDTHWWREAVVVTVVVAVAVSEVERVVWCGIDGIGILACGSERVGAV